MKNRILKLTGIILCLVVLCGIGMLTASAAEIRMVQVYDIDAPNPGVAPDFTGTVKNPAYCIQYGEHGVFWYGNDGSSMSCDDYTSFQKGVVYTVRIYVEPNGSNDFPTSPADMTAFFGDGNIRVNIDENSNGKYIEYTFDKCGTISTIALAPPFPVAGEKADFTAVKDGRYYSYGNVSPAKNGIKWYDETSESYMVSGTASAYFQQHHTYTVMYTLRTDESVFSSEATATAHGEATTTEWCGDEFFLVQYTFDPLCEPELVEATAATCGKPGNTQHYACSCGNLFEDALGRKLISDKNSVVIPATNNHKPVLTGASAATCSKTGYTGDKICSVCKTTTQKGTVIEKNNNHTSVVSLKAVPATCTKAGKTEGKKCTACGKITVAQKATALAAHKIVALPAKAPTYTQTGLTAGEKCSSCGKITVAQKSVAKKKLSKVKIKKAKSSKKKYLSLVWGKVSGASRYQVQYSTSKSFKKKVTKTTKSTKLTIKKLKSKKKYYVRVRAYKVVNGQKVYSSWSSVKSVKIK